LLGKTLGSKLWQHLFNILRESTQKSYSTRLLKAQQFPGGIPLHNSTCINTPPVHPRQREATAAGNVTPLYPAPILTLTMEIPHPRWKRPDQEVATSCCQVHRNVGPWKSQPSLLQCRTQKEQGVEAEPGSKMSHLVWTLNDKG
ncbi:Hypothetical predicted protein, partial [Pelobates cultripes]